MTIDVEDYFQVSAFKKVIDPGSWDSIACRVENNVDLLLDVLEKNSTKATFFTLGWIAERHPVIIRKIIAAGHELASHGYGHQMISDMTHQGFTRDVVLAKKVLEDVSGIEVVGYRAPSFSIVEQTLWAHEILAQTGHIYSSSVYPISHDLYGIPNSPRFAYKPVQNLTEYPATSVRFRGRNFPASGGGFFRLFPLPLSKAIISRVNCVDEQAAIFYCHPWEFDPKQPRIYGASAKSQFRHYLNLKANLNKFDRLLAAFDWAPMRDVFPDTKPTVERLTEAA